ncbi:hypothetical protein SGLAM104S_06544 [Streptomyces glaucescens]
MLRGPTVPPVAVAAPGRRAVRSPRVAVPPGAPAADRRPPPPPVRRRTPDPRPGRPSRRPSPRRMPAAGTGPVAAVGSCRPPATLALFFERSSRAVPWRSTDTQSHAPAYRQCGWGFRVPHSSARVRKPVPRASRRAHSDRMERTTVPLFDTRVPAVLLRTDRNPFHHGTLGAVRSLGRTGVEVHVVADCAGSPVGRSRFVRRLHAPPARDACPDQIAAVLRRVAATLAGPAVLVPILDPTRAPSPWAGCVPGSHPTICCPAPPTCCPNTSPTRRSWPRCARP